MGSVDSCELSELVGLYLLNGLKAILDEDQDGLYRDDLLAYIRGLSGPQIATRWTFFRVKLEFEFEFEISWLFGPWDLRTP